MKACLVTILSIVFSGLGFGKWNIRSYKVVNPPGRHTFWIPSTWIFARRKIIVFLTTLGCWLLVAGTLVQAAGTPTQKPTVKVDVLPIKVSPDVRIGVIQSELGCFLGIGNVSIHGIQLRNASHPMLVRC